MDHRCGIADEGPDHDPLLLEVAERDAVLVHRRSDLGDRSVVPATEAELVDDVDLVARRTRDGAPDDERPPDLRLVPDRGRVLGPELIGMGHDHVRVVRLPACLADERLRPDEDATLHRDVDERFEEDRRTRCDDVRRANRGLSGRTGEGVIDIEVDRDPGVVDRRGALVPQTETDGVRVPCIRRVRGIDDELEVTRTRHDDGLAGPRGKDDRQTERVECAPIRRSDVVAPGDIAANDPGRLP